MSTSPFQVKAKQVEVSLPALQTGRRGENQCTPSTSSLVCHKLAVTPPKAHSSSHTKTITYLCNNNPRCSMLARCTFQTLPTVPCIDPTERRLVRKPFSFSWAMRVDDSNYDAAARSLRCSCRSRSFACLNRAADGNVPSPLACTLLPNRPHNSTLFRALELGRKYNSYRFF